MPDNPAERMLHGGRPATTAASTNPSDRALRWLFLGRGAMGAAALLTLLTRRAPVAVLTEWDESPHDERLVHRVAADAGVPVHRASQVGLDPSRWPMAMTALEVAVCCGWPERLLPDVLAAPRRGWLNLHPSRLPAFRGADPISWQLLTSPSRIGCSVHWMSERFDDGPLVARGYAPLQPDTDGAAARRQCGGVLGDLAGTVLQSLAAGDAVAAEPQLQEDATTCPPLGTVPLLDPHGISAMAAARVARAFSPTPGIALTVLTSRQRFAFTRVGERLGADESPGQLVADSEMIAVACRDQWLIGSPPPTRS